MASDLLEAKNFPRPVEQASMDSSAVTINTIGIGSTISYAVYPRDSFFNRKYLLDNILGWALLVPALPLIAVLWLAVKVTSRGPGFYLQTRVGLRGRLFRIVKLRTMHCDAEAGGIQWSSKGDPRVTWLGRIMRRLHLDELPQLWNVARGDMCLVGPRPERPEIARSLEKLIPGYQMRHLVKPGVTGLAQVNLEPDSNINLTRKKQILDLRYIDKANAWLDARLLFATFLRILGIKGEKVMRWNFLEQKISNRELIGVGYEFDVEESQLWSPNKGLV